MKRQNYIPLFEEYVNNRPKSDEERAQTHFNINYENWESLSDEEKNDYLSKLPERGQKISNLYEQPSVREITTEVLIDSSEFDKIIKDIETTGEGIIREEDRETLANDIINHLVSRYFNVEYVDSNLYIDYVERNVEFGPEEKVIEPVEPVEPIKGPIERPIITEAKRKTKPKYTKRGDCVFQSTNKAVKDKKDHFPINNIAQARNALARASQYDKSPEWYIGSLSSLVKKVQTTIKNKYPSIKVTKALAKPEKNGKINHE